MIRIFIETKTFKTNAKKTNEERFILHLIGLEGYDLSKVEVTGTDGYTNLVVYEEQVKRNSAESGKNIVIFDADSAENGGGFEKRKAFLLEIKKNNGC